MAATSGNSCSGEDCFYLLAFGVALAPVGAVIGAGAGVVEVVEDHRRANKAAAAVLAPQPCPDAKTREWLRQCEARQGALPAGAQDAQLDSWFDQCETALAERLKITRQAELPAECLAHPVPQWMVLDCKRKASLIEARHGETLTFLKSERKRRQGSPEFAHCTA